MRATLSEIHLATPGGTYCGKSAAKDTFTSTLDYSRVSCNKCIKARGLDKHTGYSMADDMDESGNMMHRADGRPIPEVPNE
jgi:hypothetical protein